MEDIPQRLLILAALVSGNENPGTVAVTMAQSIVRRAAAVQLTNPELARFALRLLKDACNMRASHFMSSADWTRSLTLALKLGGVSGNLSQSSSDAIAYANFHNWIGVNDTGRFFPTPDTDRILGEPLGGWKEAGLPNALEELALALEKYGGDVEARKLLVETGRSPADTLKKYPSWNAWIDKHIKRVRRGVYRLE